MKYLPLIAAATLSLAGPVNAGEYLPTTFPGTFCNVLQMGGTLENAYAAAYNDGYLKSLPSGPVMTLNGRTDTWDHHQTLSAMENRCGRLWDKAFRESEAKKKRDAAATAKEKAVEFSVETVVPVWKVEGINYEKYITR